MDASGVKRDSISRAQSLAKDSQNRCEFGALLRASGRPAPTTGLAAGADDRVNLRPSNKRRALVLAAACDLAAMELARLALPLSA